jgi:hypothetical protein
VGGGNRWTGPHLPVPAAGQPAVVAVRSAAVIAAADVRSAVIAAADVRAAVIAAADVRPAADVRSAD